MASEDNAAEASADEETLDESEQLLEKMQAVANARNPFFNVSYMKLREVSDALLNLTFLQYLYMAFNSLQSLPANFFSCLPNLKWLDLRVNQLSCLPSLDLSDHQFLEYLLLEDNSISHLPIELGFVKPLRGLALTGNPLEFPHAEILSEGVQSVKQYLREVYEGRMEIEQRIAMENEAAAAAGPVDDSGSQREGSGEEAAAADASAQAPAVRDDSRALPRPPALRPLASAQSRDEQAARAQADPMYKPPTLSSLASSQSRDEEEPLAARAQGARLHKPPAAATSQIRQRHLVRAPNRARPVTKQSDKHALYVNPYPEPPPLGLVERRAAEEHRQAKRRETLNKQEAVLQRRRDAEATRQWKEESKKLQMAKAREQLLKGAQKIGMESEGRIAAAPFSAGWEPQLLQLPTGAELQQQRWQGEVPAEPRPEPLSADQLRHLELQRRQQEAEIAEQIHLHTRAMMERRRQAGHASAAQEVQAAKRDVEILHRLRQSLFSASGRLALQN